MPEDAKKKGEPSDAELTMANPNGPWNQAAAADMEDRSSIERSPTDPAPPSSED